MSFTYIKPKHDGEEEGSEPRCVEDFVVYRRNGRVPVVAGTGGRLPNGKLARCPQIPRASNAAGRPLLTATFSLIFRRTPQSHSLYLSVSAPRTSESTHSRHRARSEIKVTQVLLCVCSIPRVHGIHNAIQKALNHLFASKLTTVDAITKVSIHNCPALHDQKAHKLRERRGGIPIHTVQEVFSQFFLFLALALQTPINVGNDEHTKVGVDGSGIETADELLGLLCLNSFIPSFLPTSKWATWADLWCLW